MENPPKHFDLMASAYIDGINLPLAFKIHSKLSVLALVWDGFGYPIPFKLSLTDWMRYYFWQGFFFVAYWLPGFEKFMNWCTLRSFQTTVEKMFHLDIADQIKKYHQM